MIIFVLTKNGFNQIKALIRPSETILWLNENVLTSDKIEALRAAGVETTNFTYYVTPNNADQMAGAIDTILEHHPGENIWVEHS